MTPLCINIARSQRLMNVQLQSTKMWKSCYLGHNKTTWYSTGTNYSVFLVMTQLLHNLEDSVLLIHWSGQSIRQKANVKPLSVIFDQHVTWIDQRNNIIRSTPGTLRVLWKFRKFTPTTVRKTLAKALILYQKSIIATWFMVNCLSIWSTGFNEYKTQLQVMSMDGM